MIIHANDLFFVTRSVNDKIADLVMRLNLPDNIRYKAREYAKLLLDLKFKKQIIDPNSSEIAVCSVYAALREIFPVVNLLKLMLFARKEIRYQIRARKIYECMKYIPKKTLEETVQNYIVYILKNLKVYDQRILKRVFDIVYKICRETKANPRTIVPPAIYHVLKESGYNVRYKDITAITRMDIATKMKRFLNLRKTVFGY